MPAPIVCRFAGVQFRSITAQIAFAAIEDMDQQLLVLVREPDNPYDANAVQVWTKDREHFIAFVPKKIAARIAPDLDADPHSWSAEVVYKKLGLDNYAKRLLLMPIEQDEAATKDAKPATAT